MRSLAKAAAYLAALMISFCSIHPAQASLIAYEGFENSTIGALSGQSGGTGWTGAQTNWAAIAGLNVAANNLSYSNGTVLVNGGNNVARITADSTSAASRSFADQTGTVYFSFLFRNNAGTVEANDFISMMMNNDANVTDSGGVGKPTNLSTALGARIGTSNGGDTTDSATAMLAGTTYFLVGSVSKVSSTNYNRVQLYINPTSDIEPGVASITDSATSAFSTISFFSLRSLNIDADDDYQFDELRIGTTFADVVPVAVPEPGTIIAFSLAAGLLVYAKRHLRRAV